SPSCTVAKWCCATTHRACWSNVVSTARRSPPERQGPQLLQRTGPEGIAGLRLATLEALREPALALRGAAMREALGHHIALRLLLDHVVTDRGRGRQCIPHVLFSEPVARIVGPHAGETVRLQFHAHLQRVLLLL